eukprot:2755527-Prorocentrum_lima.AAC.1
MRTEHQAGARPNVHACTVHPGQEMFVGSCPWSENAAWLHVKPLAAFCEKPLVSALGPRVA